MSNLNLKAVVQPSPIDCTGYQSLDNAWRNDAVPAEVDCLILGGGITGAGVARDAAMRGMRTLLVDSQDFASGTSHLTSKVVHGGLRYLEHCRFRLVVEGIVERDRLLNRMAPHLVSPLRFMIPFENTRVPKWVATVLGLQVYGAVEQIRAGRRSLPLNAADFAKDYPGLLPHRFGVSFWDARTNDARLVMSTMRTAVASGATIINYTKLIGADFDGRAWTVTFESEPLGRNLVVRARSIVNATGPWAPETSRMLGGPSMELIWIKGSHLVMARPRNFGSDAVVIRSVRDNRTLWVIPWENRLIVGSTESRFTGNLREVYPSAEEVLDLFESYARYFPGMDATYSDIRCAYAGIRPIVQQGGDAHNQLSRRHEIVLDEARRLVTINGGKLTTFRKMAEQAMDRLGAVLSCSPPSRELRRLLRNAPLWPGLSKENSDHMQAEAMRHYPALSSAPDRLAHLVRHYGRDGVTIALEAAESFRAGEPLCEDLPYTLAELSYLCRTERVCRLADLLKRRTPLYFLSERGGAGFIREIVSHVRPVLGWDRHRCEMEMAALAEEFRANFSAVPQEPAVFPRLAAACA